MKLEMTGQMRMEQRMKLAPHMIQSMEILQLPILALQERIEQEINNNPVLELVDPANPEEPAEAIEQESSSDIEQRDLVVSTDNDKVQDFERLESLDDDFKDYMSQAGPMHYRSYGDETDKKLDAL
ncbi:MAG: hypothetical protein P8016_00675, partial [Sedimentisphaerales bacterium]